MEFHGNQAMERQPCAQFVVRGDEPVGEPVKDTQIFWWRPSLGLHGRLLSGLDSFMYGLEFS